MTPAKVIARLRRLAEDWRHEERRLCEQFGDVVASQSMRARQIKDTQAIDAAIEMIERTAKLEQALQAMTKTYKSVPYAQWPAEMHLQMKRSRNRNDRHGRAAPTVRRGWEEQHRP